MGFFSKIIRKVTKPIKKVIRSPIGKAALLGAGIYGLGGGTFFGKAMPGITSSKGFAFSNIIPNLIGSEGGNQGILGALKLTKGSGSLMPTGLGIGALAGIGTAAAANQPSVDEAFASNQDTAGHDAYLNTRKYFPFGDTSSQYYTAPLYNEGGRVKARQGMYAGEGLASLPTDQMQNPIDQGVLDAGTTAQGQSEDAEFIALIQQLAAMGIPMEQLRGRTKEELVEMMVYISSKVQGRGVQEDVGVEEEVRMSGGGNIFLKESTEVLEDRPDGSSESMTEEESQVNYPELARGEAGSPVVEEKDNIQMASYGYDDAMGEAFAEFQRLRKLGEIPLDMEFDEWLDMQDVERHMNQGGIMRTGYAMGSEHPIIPSKDGMQLDMRTTGGYQPHGKAEKHDDVRALLAQGEFVMTSDAVKGLGGGDRDEGAKKMYDIMHKLEAMA